MFQERHLFYAVITSVTLYIMAMKFYILCFPIVPKNDTYAIKTIALKKRKVRRSKQLKKREEFFTE